MNQTVENKISITPILLVNFIGTLGYSIILPFLIVLVIRLGGNEMIYGIMGATYSFFQFIGAPIMGRWSDKFGRKRILLLSQTGTFLAWGLFIIALLIPNTELLEVNSTLLGVFVLTVPLIVLFMARALDGLTGGNVSVANAYLADVSDDNNRKSNFGKMAASANLGFIIGPALAGVLGSTLFGELVPVAMAMTISLIAIGVIALLMKETTQRKISESLETDEVKKIFGQEHKECYKIEGTKEISFREVLKLQNISFILILYFLIFLAFNFFYVAFPIHAIQGLDWSLWELGVFFSVMGFVMVIVQGPVLTKISNKIADSKLTVGGSLLLGAGFVLFTSSNIILIYTAVVLFSIGNGIMWPSFLSILSKMAGDKFQGAIQGYASSAGSLASILGLITGGVIYGIIGVDTFYIPACLLVLIFLMCFRLIKMDKSSSS